MANYQTKSNSYGPTLGYSPDSGVQLLHIDGLYFKDLNRSGQLEPYKDWRLPAEQRAADLASRLSIAEIAGLMLYSAHQAIPARANRHFASATYGGKSFDEAGVEPWALSDQQIEFLKSDNVRHVLVTTFHDALTAARWNNNVQALCEGIGFGIPANNSSDPRHGSDFTAEYNMGSGGFVSHWPESLGLAATFDPALVEEFGRIASREYRLLGIATALSPQIDTATDPRWSRFVGTFGESPELSRDMAKAYCQGFQRSDGDREISGGWGYDSVNAMVKHWPGGATGEGGRDAHFAYGKYAVYPGDNFDEHLLPFTEGAFRLDVTGSASAVMPYYTISQGKDSVANAYSQHIITQLLREKYGFQGVVCTDWGVTKDIPDTVDGFQGKPWGVEQISEAERHYRALMAGVDQFGGNNAAGPVLEAYQMGVAEHGEAFMRKRFEQSAQRLLVNFFRTGLFENPYLEEQITVDQVGCKEYVDAGKAAQERSIILLKNRRSTLPQPRKTKVYLPKRYIAPRRTFFGTMAEGRWEDALPHDLVAPYYDLVGPEEADFALVILQSPQSGSGYDAKDREAGGNGYVPISLQYRPYTAQHARKPSLAGGDPLEDFTDRSYLGKSATTDNEADLDLLLKTRQEMGHKPVVAVIRLNNPLVPAEFEPACDAILAHSGVETEALMRILTGAVEPSALLPMQLPRDMQTVEEQFEDVPFDMQPYVDEQGNAYDFAFGMNWSGVIEDERVRKYRR